jgi:hypothetical protein
MSCAVFTLIGLYALIKGKSNAWIIGASLTAAVVFFYVAAFLAWREEYIKRLQAEKQLNDEEPRVIFGLVNPLIEWSSLVGSGEYVFTLTNCGKRPATYVRVQPVTSLAGTFTIYFEDRDVLRPDGHYQPIKHEISDGNKTAVLDKKMLWDFLHNNPAERQTIEFDVIVRFKDGQDAKEIKFKMQFDLNSKKFSIVPV